MDPPLCYSRVDSVHDECHDHPDSCNNKICHVMVGGKPEADEAYDRETYCGMVEEA